MAHLSDNIYMSSPVWIQQLIVSCYGWWWYRRRFGHRFEELVKDFVKRENWSAVQFQKYQEERLALIIQKAWSSKYYRVVFDQAGITSNMEPFEVLFRLPLLSKENLRKYARELLTEDPSPKGTVVFKSSGTTGTPTEIFYTHDLHQMEMAWLEARVRRWAGLNFRDRRVMFGVRKVCRFNQSKPPFWRISPAENMAYMSVYHLSPKFLPSYLSFLRKYQPKLIMGYPNSIYTLARFALDHGDMPAPAKAVITTSETVTTEMRETIESAWECRLFDTYGAVEACVFASQCEHGRYHLSPDVGILEILDRQGKPCPPGVAGEAVCTGLQNTLQPLIRYRIGDVAIWSPETECACGRHMPILQSVEGRFEDMCYTTDGRAMLRFDTVFKGIKAIREAQVVQEKLDSFVIYVVPDHNFNKDEEKKIRHNMRHHVGNVEVKIKQVPLIERSKVGKFRPVICKLSREERLMAKSGWK